jgi:hypothetical protein
MTKLLEKAFKKASRLPVVDQNALAKWLLTELEVEQQWQARFADSEGVLEALADEALEAYCKGKVKPLDLDRL